MAAIDLTSGSASAYGSGELQLQGKVQMTTTPTAVTDNLNVASALLLATNLVQTTSTLRITTNDNPYIDAEDGSGDNRFTIGRATSSQQVNVDFASNPTGSTTSVGAIRTYIDGVNLSEAITFIENGSIGVGTTAPNASALFDISSTTKGFLPPRMTNAQKNAIASPTSGLIVHDTTNNGVAYYDGSTWGYLSGAKQTLTGSGGTLNVGFRNGNIVDLTLTASTTLTFASHVIGTYIIQVTQGGTGSYTLTYPASVKWSGGVAPTLTTTVGKTDILTFYHDGTTFFGTYSLNY